MADQKGKRMTSVSLSVDSHTIMKLIKKRYKDAEGVRTQDDAFLLFIREHDAGLYNEAMRIAELKRQLDEALEDAE